MLIKLSWALKAEIGWHCPPEPWATFSRCFLPQVQGVALGALEAPPARGAEVSAHRCPGTRRHPSTCLSGVCLSVCLSAYPEDLQSHKSLRFSCSRFLFSADLHKFVVTRGNTLCDTYSAIHIVYGRFPGTCVSNGIHLKDIE